MGCLSELRSGDVGGDMDEVNVFNPGLKNCEERYDDLCDYFNNDPETIKTILWDRKEFKAWLERMHWHVQECNRLGREVDRLRKELDNKAQPKAYWIDEGPHENKQGVKFLHVFRCSSCGELITRYSTWADLFCKHCGHRMMNAGENNEKAD